MSTTTAPAALCAGLVDDAAVFPPGRSPVDRAWLGHRELLQGPYAGCVGPLLLAPEHVTPLVSWLEQQPPREDPGPGCRGMPVVLVARSGVSLGDVDTALADLMAGWPARRLRVVGLEVAHTSGWQRLLTLGLPLVVEVPRDGHGRDLVLGQVAAARGAGHRVRAKLRTQSTASAPVPTADELSRFLLACVDRAVPFKLTGGLHHAVAGEVLPQGGHRPERRHGALNVLLATHDVLTDRSPADVVGTLRTQDAQELTRRALDLSPAAVDRLRASFTAYGCCGVLEPLTELAGLGLLHAAPAPVG